MTSPGTQHDEAFWKRFFQRPDVICPVCRYSMHGLRSPQCSECGHVGTIEEFRIHIDVDEALWYRNSLRVLWIVIAIGMIPGMACIGVASSNLVGWDGTTSRTAAALLLGIGVVLAGGLPLIAWSIERYKYRLAHAPIRVREMVVAFVWLMAMLGVLATIVIVIEWVYAFKSMMKYL